MIPLVTATPTPERLGGTPGETAFSELWHPLVHSYERRLGKLAPGLQAVTSRQCRIDLASAVLDDLATTALPEVYADFDRYRTNQLGPFAPYATAERRELYDEYIERRLGGGPSRLFAAYPGLARPLTMRILQAAEAHAELLRHLADDAELLQRTFSPRSRLGRVICIETGLSDRHGGGRTVMRLGFESGVRVVYKPRPLGLDRAVNEFLQCLDDCLDGSWFYDLRILDGGEYGWEADVEYASVAGPQELANFQERTGALLAALYVLMGTDYHRDNIIAHGAYPVAVDHECALSPGRLSLGDASGQHTVRDIGILPPDIGEPGSLEDCSMLGRGPAPERIVLYCTDIGTDAMQLVRARTPRPPRTDVPSAELVPAGAVVYGFMRVYRLLLELPPEEGERLIAPLKGHWSRVILRNTRDYLRLLENAAVAPGVGGPTLDWPTRVHGGRAVGPEIRAVLESEHRALARGDIPLFRCRTDSEVLEDDMGVSLRGVIRMRAHDLIRERLQSLSEEDLALQVALIRDVFVSDVHAHPWPESAKTTSSIREGDRHEPRRDDLPRMDRF